jgi:hypothetical protein
MTAKPGACPYCGKPQIGGGCCFVNDGVAYCVLTDKGPRWVDPDRNWNDDEHEQAVRQWERE